MLSPDTVSMENHPRGGGADGEGDGASPAPVSCISTRHSFSVGGRDTPTARPLTRPPPAPSRGGGQVFGDSTGYRVRGRRPDLRECQVRPRSSGLLPGHRIYGESPPWGEGLTGRGVEHPPPLSPAYQPDTLLPWEVETPPPPGRSAASSRPLPRGRALWGDSTGYCAIGGERIFQECQVRPRRDCQIPGHCIYGTSPAPSLACHQEDLS